eukprot:g12960.t1
MRPRLHGRDLLRGISRPFRWRRVLLCHELLPAIWRVLLAAVDTEWARAVPQAASPSRDFTVPVQMAAFVVLTMR